VSVVDVYEVKLDDELLMSSLFTAGENALARAWFGEAAERRTRCRGGGPGLGYTACAALDDSRVRSQIVVEALAEVIEWHARGLVPLGTRLTSY
jgi:hypothetical protein